MPKTLTIPRVPQLTAATGAILSVMEKYMVKPEISILV
jgi:hypothetical protein